MSEPGVCQWFHYEAYADLERAKKELGSLGVKRLRTGVSWADFHRPNGRAWYDHQMKSLAGLDLLVSIWHTPPSRSENGTCAGPPARLRDYADFVWQVLDLYGDKIEAIELWNEPNNRYKWDFPNCDPDWRKFGDMVAMAAEVVRAAGKTCVLGGMIPVDPAWLGLMKTYGAFEKVDAVGIHAFPGMWWGQAPNWDWYSHWQGWEAKLGLIRAHTDGKPVWVTETGRATWALPESRPGMHHEQLMRLRDALSAPADRLYWYSLIDLDPVREAIEGFHVDENEYHMGLVSWLGERKPAWHALKAHMALGGQPVAHPGPKLKLAASG